MTTHEVIVGNVGTVYRSEDDTHPNGKFRSWREWRARQIFAEWVEASKADTGRAGGEPVTLLDEDGEIADEYFPEDYDPS